MNGITTASETVEDTVQQFLCLNLVSSITHLFNKKQSYAHFLFAIEPYGINRKAFL